MMINTISTRMWIKNKNLCPAWDWVLENQYDTLSNQVTEHHTMQKVETCNNKTNQNLALNYWLIGSLPNFISSPHNNFPRVQRITKCSPSYFPCNAAGQYGIHLCLQQITFVWINYDIAATFQHGLQLTTQRIFWIFFPSFVTLTQANPSVYIRSSLLLNPSYPLSHHTHFKLLTQLQNQQQLNLHYINHDIQLHILQPYSITN